MGYDKAMKWKLPWRQPNKLLQKLLGAVILVVTYVVAFIIFAGIIIFMVMRDLKPADQNLMLVAFFLLWVGPFAYAKTGFPWKKAWWIGLLAALGAILISGPLIIIWKNIGNLPLPWPVHVELVISLTWPIAVVGILEFLMISRRHWKQLVSGLGLAYGWLFGFELIRTLVMNISGKTTTSVGQGTLLMEAVFIFSGILLLIWWFEPERKKHLVEWKQKLTVLGAMDLAVILLNYALVA